MNGTIMQWEGQLVVVSEWDTSDSTPEMARTYWPTGLRASDWSQLEGQEARSIGNGQYRCQNGFIVELLNGAATTGCHRETKPIRKPKWAVSWRDGKWYRF